MAAPAAAPRPKSRLGTWIAGAMVVGIVIGHLVHVLSPDPATTKTIAGYFSLLTDIFLRLIKMVIAPLVFSTLVAGMAGHKEGGAGRIGMKAMGWFLTASVVSLLLGLLLVNVLQPGAQPGAAAARRRRHDQPQDLGAQPQGVRHPPRAPQLLRGHGGNEILQILVFSIFFGVALSAFKDETAATITKILQELVHVMLKLTGDRDAGGARWASSEPSPRPSRCRGSACWPPTAASSPASTWGWRRSGWCCSRPAGSSCAGAPSSWCGASASR